jgi:predicted metal-dependent phosphoesterase TrpH
MVLISRVPLRPCSGRPEHRQRTRAGGQPLRQTMLKVELHTHTADDPEDYIPYTTQELVDRAARLEYDALAITLHSRQLDLTPELSEYARVRGITLIPGVEVSIEGRHVLLINFPPEAGAERVQTFDEIAALRARVGGTGWLVVAPHPFYPASSCLNHHLEAHADLFDAVEISAFHTRWVDFNRRARAWARAHGKPLVGNCDVHRLNFLGPTYSLVDAPCEPTAICDAIRAGRVEVRSTPLSSASAAYQLGQLLSGDVQKVRWRKSGRPAPVSAA